MTADLEGQGRTVGIADIDGLAVLDIDDGHPAVPDEHPVEAAVIDGAPSALVKPKQQVGAGDQGVCDADVSAKVAPDDDVVAC
jgi:hypothetical protein